MDLFSLEQAINDVQLLKLIHFYEFSLKEQTDFYHLYEKNTPYLLFLNTEKDNQLSLFDISELRIISKFELFLKYSNNLESDLKSIRNFSVESQDTPDLPTDIENLTRYYFSLVNPDNSIFDKSNFPNSLHIYSYKGNLSIPTFDKNNHFNNLIYSSKHSFYTVTNHPGYISSNTPVNTKELYYSIVFNPNTLFLFSQNHVTVNYQFYVINELFDYSISNKILKEIYKQSFLDFKTYVLYQDNYKEKLLTLKFIIHLVNKFTDYSCAINFNPTLSFTISGVNAEQLLDINSKLLNLIYKDKSENTVLQLKDTLNNYNCSTQIFDKSFSVVTFNPVWLKLINLDHFLSVFNAGDYLYLYCLENKKEENKSNQNSSNQTDKQTINKSNKAGL